MLIPTILIFYFLIAFSVMGLIMRAVSLKKADYELMNWFIFGVSFGCGVLWPLIPIGLLSYSFFSLFIKKRLEEEEDFEKHWNTKRNRNFVLNMISMAEDWTLSRSKAEVKIAGVSGTNISLEMKEHPGWYIVVDRKKFPASGMSEGKYQGQLVHMNLKESDNNGKTRN